HCCRGSGVTAPSGLYPLSLHDALPISKLVAITRDEQQRVVGPRAEHEHRQDAHRRLVPRDVEGGEEPRGEDGGRLVRDADHGQRDRKSTRLNSSHVKTSYAVFCLKKKN